jgi:hypothetical protein
MFIRNSICNYIAQDLFLITSRLVFALDAWATLMLIVELIVILFLVEKKNAKEEILAHCFRFV